jgi:3-methyladenine DNA glycosylase AlkC
MARGPDGKGGGAGFSLADQLFNAQSVGDLAAELAVGVPDFDADRFVAEVMAGLAERTLLARLDWIADCIEVQLSSDFNAMSDNLEASLPPRLDPDLRDDDFGRFIHGVHGVLTVRHGLEDHRNRALDLLYEATQRFSMEYYIRPFLNRWPDETLARLEVWATDPNYHVRRLVSEGTRPKLPWAKAINLDPLVPLRFLDVLYADSTRFVTRSVANHLNDIAKFAPDVVVDRLSRWQSEGRQESV